MTFATRESNEVQDRAIPPTTIIFSDFVYERHRCHHISAVSISYADMVSSKDYKQEYCSKPYEKCAAHRNRNIPSSTCISNRFLPAQVVLHIDPTKVTLSKVWLPLTIKEAPPAIKAPRVHFFDPIEQKGARQSHQNPQSQGSSHSQAQALQPITKFSLNKPLPPPPKMEQQSLAALVDPKNTLQPSVQQGEKVAGKGKDQTSQQLASQARCCG